MLSTSTASGCIGGSAGLARRRSTAIRNWREYERGLRRRGDVTIWLSEDAIAAWVPPKNGLRGGQRRYSNLAVRTALTLRVVFSLPLRQTEGFLDSLLRLMGLNLKAPDHTTLSRRNQIVVVPPLTRAHDGPCCLPRFQGGSASATSLSRPAQASLALRPAGLLAHLTVDFVTRLRPAQLPGPGRSLATMFTDNYMGGSFPHWQTAPARRT